MSRARSIQERLDMIQSVPLVGASISDLLDTLFAFVAALKMKGLKETWTMIIAQILRRRTVEKRLGEQPAHVDEVALAAVDEVIEEDDNCGILTPPASPPPASADVKNIIIVGGSVFGVAIALKARWTHKLPANYRLIIIEKHTHMHYMFAFPRASVIPGFEKELFIPYTNLFSSPKEGCVINAQAKSISPTHIELDREVPGFGNRIPYEFILYGAGARHPRPGCLSDEITKEEGIKTLKEYQSKIASSKKVLVIGGGAVGLELAAEIKEHYPEKEVTLVHSRDRYLMSYKHGLHRRTYGILKSLGVRQILGDRVVIPEGGFKNDGQESTVETRAGRMISSDLQILCTGMSPNSELLATLSPQSLNPTSRFISVRDTHQIADSRFPNIFAGGDVVDLPDIKTGVSAFAHAGVCIENVLRLINGRQEGKPDAEIELEHRTPIDPQIYLYFGLDNGIAQLSANGYLFTAGSWLVRPHFSYNILASRAWDWCQTPLSAKTVNL